MLRIGEIVHDNINPLMNVSFEYEDIVKRLIKFNYPSSEIELLACLIISQTESQYKNYLIKVLMSLDNVPIEKLIDSWQKSDLDFNEEKLSFLFSKEELLLTKGKDIEEDLHKYEKKFPNLFRDGLATEFYPTKKKGMLILRRLIRHYFEDYKKLNSFQRLILYFITAQMLVSWESSCIYLGGMILDGRKVKEMSDWFCQVWPIYKS